MVKALQLQALSKVYRTQIAVNAVNLEVEHGEFISLLGPSGCGKTSTLRLIAGFEEPNHGSIHIEGRVVADDHHFIAPESRRVGMVFQDYALFPHLSVKDNVGFGLKLNSKERDKRVMEMLDLVDLSDYSKRMPHQLSGGQQQRIALARALAPQPALLLLDEPFSNLDTALRTQVRMDVRDILKNSETTAIFVTHDQEEALSLSDRVAVMLEGKIIQYAEPGSVYNRPATPQIASFIGEANFITAQAEGSTAYCALGNVPLANPTRGEKQLMIRPEALVISTTEGVPAVVEWWEYYGHTARLGVIIEDGTHLVVRTAPGLAFQRGDTIRVQIMGRVQAY
ncbi:ABC transporter ATP-binding protein [Anaerolineales bacterium]